MRRRTVLAAVPSLLAGCFGAIDGDGSTTTTRSAPATATRTATTTQEAIESTTTTTEQPHEFVPIEPASLTATEVRTRLADHDCAELTDLPATCPSDDARIDVSVSPTVGELSGDAVEFTIENRADEPFRWNAYDWTLRKWDGNRWRRIAPLAIPAPIGQLSSTESHTYRIETVGRKWIDAPDAHASESAVSVSGLGPGVYGFSTNGHFESKPDEEFAVAAVFGFAGQGSPVRHSSIRPWVKREGSELLVRSVQPEQRPDELLISFADGEPDARLLPEHVHQLRPLTNTLPYAATDGIETIRYEGNANNVAMVDSYLSAVTPDGASGYGFHEYVFEVSIAE